MEIKTEKKSDSITMKIDGELTIYSVSDFRKSFINDTAHSREITINLSHISRFDTAGFQSLLLARRSAESGGKSIRFTDPSQAVQRFFAAYNETIEDWTVHARG